MEQIGKMLLSVIVALITFGLIFVGLNLAIDAARRRWWVLTGAGGLLAGLLAGAILQHNGIFPSGVVGVLLGGVVGAAAGATVGQVRTPSLETRTTVGNKLRPVIFVGPAVIFVAGGLVIPAISTMIISVKSGRRGDGDFTFANYDAIFNDPRDRYFSFSGWADIFTSRLFIVGAAGVVLAGVLAWASSRSHADDQVGRSAVGISRAIGVLFGLIGAAVLIGFVEGVLREPNESSIFDALTVVVSSKVTLWLVVAAFFAGALMFVSQVKRNRRLDDLGLSDAVAAVIAIGVVVISLVLFSTDDFSGRQALTLSLLAVGLLLIWVVARRTDGAGPNSLDLGAPSSSLMLVFSAVLIALAAFSTLNGVIWNNLWWVASVAGLSTMLGLMLAILADRSKRETLAKTMIFMPMAISMVGAAVIWDFVYERKVTGSQTGLFNFILDWLGFEPRGFFINATLIPWNNFFIMIIMIWIQTGFAMVVLSAAIKGVPTELVEAAKVDGANEVQVFWRVVVPQITSTILVVLTTLIIIVMKVFDLVKATTNGANGTDVLANEMFNKLRDGNFAFSSAFAVVIFLLVLPVMFNNVRRTTKELAS